MDGMRRLRNHLKGTVLAILGNHDSVLMVPELEAMGYRMLMNESYRLEKNGDSLWIAGVDDPHLYQTDDLEAAIADIPRPPPPLLLSHTPEIYREAAMAGFDLYMCGPHPWRPTLPAGRFAADAGRQSAHAASGAAPGRRLTCRVTPPPAPAPPYSTSA